MKLQDLKLFVVFWEGEAELFSFALLESTGHGFIATLESVGSISTNAGDVPEVTIDSALEQEITEANGQTYYGSAPSSEWVNAFLLNNRERFGLVFPAHQKHTAKIVFGEKHVSAYNEGDHSVPISEYEFDTEDELNAFLKGIDDGVGWLEHLQIDE